MLQLSYRRPSRHVAWLLCRPCWLADPHLVGRRVGVVHPQDGKRKQTADLAISDLG
jgi:hypothetical protein